MAFEIHQPLLGLFSFGVFTLPGKQIIHMCFEQLTYRGVYFCRHCQCVLFSWLQRSKENTDRTLFVLAIYGVSVPRLPWGQVSRLN